MQNLLEEQYKERLTIENNYYMELSTLFRITGQKIINEYKKSKEKNIQLQNITLLLNLHFDECEKQYHQLQEKYEKIITKNSKKQYKKLIKEQEKKAIGQKRPETIMQQVIRNEIATKANKKEILKSMVKKLKGEEYTLPVDEELNKIKMEKTFQQKPNPKVKQRLEKQLKNNQTIPRYKKEITEIITKSETEGLGIKQVADEIQKKFNKIKGYEARRIATTEINSANNYVTYQELVNDEVVNYKQWITCEDNRVRPTHIELNGQITRIGDKFSNGLEYPGDHNGKASEVINCRCTLIPYFLDWDKIPPNTTTFYEKDLKSMEDYYTQEKDKLITEQINIINANQNLAKPTKIPLNEEETEYKKLVEQLDKANIKYKINDDGKLEFENKIDEVLVTAHQKELLQKYYGKIKITQKKPKKKKEEDEDTKIEKLIQRGKQLKQKLKRKKKKTKAQQHTEQIKKRYPDYEPPEYFEEEDPFTIIEADKKYAMSLMRDNIKLTRQAREVYPFEFRNRVKEEEVLDLVMDWTGDDYNDVRDFQLGKLDPVDDKNKIKKAEKIIAGLHTFKNKLKHDTVLLRGVGGTYDYDMTIGAINEISTTSSTSLSKNIAHNFANQNDEPFIWVILAPKGTPMVPVLDHSIFNNEVEILLHQKQKFQTLVVDEEKGIGIVKLINKEEDKLTLDQINNLNIDTDII